jgi:DNA repair protein RadC
MLYRGTVNSTQIRVGEVFRQAIIENSPSILLVHNHPTGDPTPSPEDVAITKEIHKAGVMLDIQVLDHMIIGKETFVSLREKGLGFE